MQLRSITPLSLCTFLSWDHEMDCKEGPSNRVSPTWSPASLLILELESGENQVIQGLPSTLSLEFVNASCLRFGKGLQASLHHLPLQGAAWGPVALKWTDSTTGINLISEVALTQQPI